MLLHHTIEISVAWFGGFRSQQQSEGGLKFWCWNLAAWGSRIDTFFLIIISCAEFEIKIRIRKIVFDIISFNMAILIELEIWVLAKISRKANQASRLSARRKLMLATVIFLTTYFPILSNKMNCHSCRLLCQCNVDNSCFRSHFNGNSTLDLPAYHTK